MKQFHFLVAKEFSDGLGNRQYLQAKWKELKLDNETDFMTHWQETDHMTSMLNQGLPWEDLCPKLTCIHAHEWLTNSSKIWQLLNPEIKHNTMQQFRQHPMRLRNCQSSLEFVHQRWNEITCQAFRQTIQKKTNSRNCKRPETCLETSRLSQLSFATVRCLFGRSHNQLRSADFLNSWNRFHGLLVLCKKKTELRQMKNWNMTCNCWRSWERSSLLLAGVAGWFLTPTKTCHATVRCKCRDCAESFIVFIALASTLEKFVSKRSPSN